MNIGIVTAWFERGAGYVSSAYRATLSNDHKVFIYARGGEKYAIGDPVWDSDMVHWGKRYVSRIPTYIDWTDFKNWIKVNDLQLLIFNEQISWDIILKCHFRLNIPIGTYVDYYKRSTVEFFGLYDFLLCNTQRHYSVFNWHPNAIYIPWGTDIELLSPRIDMVPMQPNSTITFFHSAGMSPYRKGTDLLIRAFKKVSGDHKLIIHVQTKDRIDDELRMEILQDPRITLIEDEVPLPGLYHLGDVYVYPSRLDGIGLTIPEALACGLPVITTNEPPMNEFIEDNINGILVRVKQYKIRYDNYYWPEAECDVVDLTQAMNFYIENYTEIRKQKINSRKIAEEKYNWKINSYPLNKKICEINKNPKKVSLLLLLKIIINEYTIINYPPPFIVSTIKNMGFGKFVYSLRKFFHRL